MFHLLAHLAQRHSVTLLTYARPDEASAVANLRAAGYDLRVVARPLQPRIRRRLGQASSSLSPVPFAVQEARSSAMQNEFDGLVASNRFDAVQVESSSMQWLETGAQYRLIVDEHNLEHEVPERLRLTESSPLRRAYHGIEARKWRRVERALWHRADACMITSAREAEVVRREAVHTPVAVVPNGVDSAYFGEGAASPEPDTLVFVGLLTYRPNLDAITHFVRNVWPRILLLRPAARLTIVGYGRERDLARLRRPQVRVTGWVPDVRPYVRDAAVSIIPLRAGSGTRLKALESFSMAKAVVSTSLGCEGLEVDDGEHMLIADSDADFARATLEVLRDPVLARRLGTAARGLVEDRYVWRRCTEPMDRLYEHLFSASAASRQLATLSPQVEV